MTEFAPDLFSKVTQAQGDLTLTDREREQLVKFLSNPLAFPVPFKSWLTAWLEINQPDISLSQVIGFQDVFSKLNANWLGYPQNNSSISHATTEVNGVLVQNPSTATWRKFRVMVQTTSGNVHMGIYSLDGQTRYWKTDGVAAATYTTATISPDLVLDADKYWLCVAASNTTLRWYCGEFANAYPAFRLTMAGSDSGMPTTLTGLPADPETQFANQPVTIAITRQ